MKRILCLLALAAAATAFAQEKASLDSLLERCKQKGADARMAADEIVASHVESPALEDNLRTIADAWYWNGGGIAAVESGLKTIIAKTPHRNVRAAAMFSLAQWFFGVEKAGKEKRLEACDLLDAIQKDYADSPCAKQAKEYAELHTRELVTKEKKVERRPPSDFETGKVAPDFEAEDQDGKTFKLSEYRGKVVLLDFWGFW